MTGEELQKERRERLFLLLEIEKNNPGATVIGLKRRIIEAEATMNQEDVAWVREKIAQL
jgi:hypothetical protein